MNLQLSLKKKWFEMTKNGIKTEDYRQITPYWASRFLLFKGEKKPQLFWENEFFIVANCAPEYLLEKYQGREIVSFCKFCNNIITFGYPKSTDTNRILKLEHKGIEIRTGNPEWGAEPNKLYFVIMHGAVVC